MRPRLHDRRTVVLGHEIRLRQRIGVRVQAAGRLVEGVARNETRQQFDHGRVAGRKIDLGLRRRRRTGGVNDTATGTWAMAPVGISRRPWICRRSPPRAAPCSAINTRITRRPETRTWSMNLAMSLLSRAKRAP